MRQLGGRAFSAKKNVVFFGFLKAGLEMTDVDEGSTWGGPRALRRAALRGGARGRK